MELNNASGRCHGHGVDDGLGVYYGVVLLHNSGLWQAEAHLVGHTALKLHAKLIVAQHSPLRMFQRYALGTLG